MVSTLLRISKVPASNIHQRHAFVIALWWLVSVTPGKWLSPSTSIPIYYLLATLRFDEHPTRSFIYPLRATDLAYLILDILSLKKLEFNRNYDWNCHPHVDEYSFVNTMSSIFVHLSTFRWNATVPHSGSSSLRRWRGHEYEDNTFLWNCNQPLALRNTAEELNLYGAVLMSFFLFPLLC